MMDGIGSPFGDLFERLASCPGFCEGHVDLTVTSHGTALDYFGTNGPVVVNQREGHTPMVCLVDLATPSAEFTPAQARIVALQLMQAADLAERFSLPLPTADITRALAAALAAV